MFKKITITVALIAIIGVLVLGAANRTQAKASNESETTSQGNHGGYNDEAISVEQVSEVSATGQGNSGNGYNQGAGSSRNETASHETIDLFSSDPGDLSAEEAAALLYMREEEKLAHDVYVTLYAQWGLPVFQNISQSEQAHTDFIKALLDYFGLSDPASSEIGIFTNPDLQALYTDLIAQGSLSLADAIKVGAAIEEIDILDLQERLAQTDNQNMLNVFNNLLSGSYNHLRAFVSTLSNKTGEVYQPQYLSLEAYQAILSSTSGNGGGGGQGGNGGGGQGRGGGKP